MDNAAGWRGVQESFVILGGGVILQPLVNESNAMDPRLRLDIFDHTARLTMVAQAPKRPERVLNPNPPRPLLSGPRGCLVGSPSFGVEASSRRRPNLLPMSSGSNT
jgi:hypothetical protein